MEVPITAALWFMEVPMTAALWFMEVPSTAAVWFEEVPITAAAALWLLTGTFSLRVQETPTGPTLKSDSKNEWKVSTV
jgi:hypothetical protein